jgi:hypothetical protein
LTSYQPRRETGKSAERKKALHNEGMSTSNEDKGPGWESERDYIATNKVFTLMLPPPVATTTTASSLCSAGQGTITDGRDR